MSESIELELSYLAAARPHMEGRKSKDLRDIYFPSNSDHAKLRIRQKGSLYELTKKTQLDANDAGAQKEENISLTKEEFEALAQGDGRELAKTRYFMPYQDLIAEVDIFKGRLEGLIIIEFEFASKAEKDAFVKPDFCLADVTQEAFIAGGVLAGKTYEDIRSDLERFGYEPF